MQQIAWERCVDCLQAEMSSQAFNTWIKPLRAAWVGAKLHLLAPNRFIEDWVRGMFLSRIVELLREQAPQVVRDVVLGLDTEAIGTEAVGTEAIGTEAIAPGLDGPGFDDGLSLGKPAQPHGGNGMDASAARGGVQPASQDPLTDPAGSPPGMGDLFAPPAEAPTNGSGAAGAATGAAGNQYRQSPLVSRYTFAHFVEGKSNEMARAAALQVAENPGVGGYNPLFLCGGVGLGKTHLMHAVGNALLERNPRSRVVYVRAEGFVNDMVNALRHKAMPDFKRYYRSVDALLIDDVHFFVGKETSQEELFHTFNALIEDGQQMILTCDRYPKEIDVEERLRSRFGWGLAVSVEPPALEHRAAILMSKAAEAGAELPEKSAFFIAEKIRSNVRELEGALKTVIVSANHLRAPIDVDLIKVALKHLLAAQDRQVSLDNIQTVVADYYRIKVADLLSKSRSRSVTRPRQVAMALAKELTNHSLPEIGDSFGGRDHTTVIHACRKVKQLRETDSGIMDDYRNLLRTLTT